MGTIDIMFAGTGGYSNFYNKAKIFDLPFLFNNAKEAYEVVNGMRHISTASRPINTADDVKGLKIRVPEIDTYVALWKSWGLIVTPMPITELNMAMKTGVVDAQDNAPYHTVPVS